MNCTKMKVVAMALLFVAIRIGSPVPAAAPEEVSGGNPDLTFPDHRRPPAERAGDVEYLAEMVRSPRDRPGSVNRLFSEDIVELIQQVDESTALAYIEGLVGFGPRVTGTPACDDAGDYIYSVFSDMGLDVRYHAWSNGGYEGNNIEATLPGTDPASDEIYIICGHYDSVSGCPGADDNASGTATAMAAAEIMSQYAFNHTIRFVAFSGEEQWMLGSHVYVEEAFQNGDNIVAALNVDMIGYAESDYDRTHVKVYHDDPSFWLAAYADSVADDYYDYIGVDVIPSGFAYSDNYSFWEFGYHALFYHEWNFNPYYHTPSDIIDNLDLTYEMRVTKLALATLAELAELTPLGSIEGYVTDLNSGDPLEATVSVAGGNRRASTDETGYYHLSVLDDSTYSLEAYSYGYLPGEQVVYVPPEGVVQADFPLEEAEPGTIEGTVRGSLDGQPLVGAEVRVLDTPLSPEYTDESGFFSLQIPGGVSYDVLAAVPAFVGKTKTVFVEEGGVSTVSFRLEAAESFEEDDGGYVGLMMWEWGEPSAYGPGGAHWGEKCWATNLDGPYGNNANSPLTSTTCDLSEATAGRLNFYHYYDTESGEDGGNVSVSTDGGATWTLISPEGGYPVGSMGWNGEPGYSGSSDGWELSSFDLETWLGEQVTFRFRFGSDGASNGPGWYIDDVFFELTYPLSFTTVPDTDSIPRGAPLGFQVNASNTAAHSITLAVWSDVILPAGQYYAGNPVFGPFTVTLPAESNPSVHLSQLIPEAAPLGTYTYIMRIGSNPETVYTSDFFEFTVIP